MNAAGNLPHIAYKASMRQFGIFGCMLAAVLIAPLQAHGAPLRVLTYHFSLDVHGFDTSQGIASTGNMSYGGSTMSLGRSGTITVNVLSATKDGGLVVEAAEQVDHNDRPLQKIRCAVYEAPPLVVCDQNLVQAGVETEEVDTLLSYVGQQFYDTSRLDDNNHWQYVEPLNDGKSTRTTDFTVTKADGNVLAISVNRVFHSGSGTSTTTGTLRYDSGNTVPLNGHFQTDSNEGGELSGSMLDFNLLSDSLTKH